MPVGCGQGCQRVPRYPLASYYPGSKIRYGYPWKQYLMSHSPFSCCIGQNQQLQHPDGECDTIMSLTLRFLVKSLVAAAAGGESDKWSWSTISCSIQRGSVVIQLSVEIRGYNRCMLIQVPGYLLKNWTKFCPIFEWVSGQLKDKNDSPSHLVMENQKKREELGKHNRIQMCVSKL